jgi:hypothetical protein
MLYTAEFEIFLCYLELKNTNENIRMEKVNSLNSLNANARWQERPHLQCCLGHYNKFTTNKQRLHFRNFVMMREGQPNVEYCKCYL